MIPESDFSHRRNKNLSHNFYVNFLFPYHNILVNLCHLNLYVLISIISSLSYGLNNYHRNSRYSDDDTDEGTNGEHAEKQPVRVSLKVPYHINVFNSSMKLILIISYFFPLQRVPSNEDKSKQRGFGIFRSKPKESKKVRFFSRTKS